MPPEPNSALPPRRLGRTDVHLGPLGFGGAHIGELYEKLSEPEAAGTVARAWELGVRYFDTAPWYGHGLSEHRLGHFLRHQPRESFVLSTKVGRVYRAPSNAAGFDSSPWAGGLPFEHRFDYTGDGILRSFEDSLQRLGLNRVDLLLIHDLDLQYHRTEAGVEQRLRELDESGWRVLDSLRSAGAIRGIGAGINAPGLIGRFVDRFDLDFFLVAMPYTLLDQSVLHDEFPACAAKGIGIVVGAPFASGILATGPREDAKYDYGPATGQTLDKVRRIQAICEAHGVPLAAAALQFPLGHPSVAAVIPGAVSPAQVESNVTLVDVGIPASLWADLKSERLIEADAPTPG